MAADQQNAAEPASNKLQDLYTADTFEETLGLTLVVGQTWYLIPHKWFQQCRKHLGFTKDTLSDSDSRDDPGPIDTQELLDPADTSAVRRHLIEEMDFSLVPEVIWNQLVAQFGLVEGAKPIPRIAREYGMFVKYLRVEIHPFPLILTFGSSTETTVKRNFSRGDKLEDVIAEMRKVFNVADDKEVRLWFKYDRDIYETAPAPSSSVQESGLYPSQTVALEVKNEDGTWTRRTRQEIREEEESKGKSSTSTSQPPPPPAPAAPAAPVINGVKKEASPVLPTAKYDKFNRFLSDSNEVEDGKPGLCGLSNLGNTCFMNSIIQGLSNTPAIAEYFENDNYEEDINEDNPLGMKGEIARSFGQLIKDMWSGRYNHVMPRSFKMVVGRFAPQFSGYQQQDSQELLIFLLDGLHEDLNRIKKKPYVEMSDCDDREDPDIAREAWENYKRRNDSVILDIFHGLQKSTLVCPVCKKVSVTFDPMCFLSLPLPVKKERQIEFVFVPMNGQVPIQYKVTVPKEGKISDLLEAAGKKVNLPVERLVATDVYTHRFHKVYSPKDSLSDILDKDEVYVYEITDPKDTSQVSVPVYMKCKKSPNGISPTSLFGQPIFITAPADTNRDELYEQLLKRMSRFVTRPEPGSEWWKTPKEDKMEVEKMEVEKMEVNGTPSTPSPWSEESPTSELSLPNNIQQQTDQEESVEDEWEHQDKMFNIIFCNSYGNVCQFEDPSPDGALHLESKKYIGLEWHPKAKQMFYNEYNGDETCKDDSVDSTLPPKKQMVDLKECLKLYTSQEKLGADDAWYCPRCKEHQQATKKFDLWMLPEVLIISLKRFSYNRFTRDKIDVHVNFPVKGLDLTPFVIAPEHGKAVYDLIAVSNHYGGLGGGHYTAYGKNRNDGKWYYFDDNNVTEAKGDIVTNAGYVLFYQRRSNCSNAKLKDLPAAAGSAAVLQNGATPALQNGLALHNGTNGVSSSDEDMEVN